MINIQKSRRKIEGTGKTIRVLTTMLSVLIFIPPLAGAMTLILVFLLRLLSSKIVGINDPASLLILFYVITIAILIVGFQTIEAVKLTIESIDHAISRALSIIVVGLSDLGRGRSWIALLAYITLGFVSLYIAYLYVSNVVGGTEAGRQATRILLGQQADVRGLWEATKASAAFAYSIAVIWIPLAFIFRKRWRNTIKRPKLSIHDAICQSESANPLKIVHASDLHSRAPSLDSGDHNKKLKTALARIADDATHADYVLITGDLTDDGSFDAWQHLLLDENFQALQGKLVLAPGNHDINAVREKWWQSLLFIESPRKERLGVRSLNYLRAVNEVMGDRCRLISPFSGRVITLAQILTQLKQDIEAWENSKPRRHAKRPSELIADLFPMVVALPKSKDSKAKAVAVIWNTVKPNLWYVLNAVGEIDRAQLSRAETLLAECADSESALLHLMHHQIGVPNVAPTARDKSLTLMQRFFGAGMGLQNPEEWVNWMSRRHQHSIVLHGHRHKYYVVDSEDSMATIVSGPSATHGVEMTYSEDVRVGPEGRWLLLDIETSASHATLVRMQVRSVSDRSLDEGPVFSSD